MRFKSLKSLNFSDAMYKCTPITVLTNYRSYIVYNLPHVQMLDDILITTEERSAATVSYLRMFIYYLFIYFTLTNCVHRLIYKCTCIFMQHIKTLTLLMKINISFFVWIRDIFNFVTFRSIVCCIILFFYRCRLFIIINILLECYTDIFCR